MLPNLIIIGAMKCGTTSLHYYLGFHPQIQMSAIKELDFFVDQLNWRNGTEWYESQFYGQALIHGEASQNYTNYPQFGGVPARIYALVPSAKLIYLVRDPIERIVSHYLLNFAQGTEKRDLEEALTAEDKWRYLDRSKYYMQIEQYLQHFPRTQLLILQQEDLYARRRETLRSVFRFLGVDDTIDRPEFSKIINPASKRRRKNWFAVQINRWINPYMVERIPYDIRVPLSRIIFWPFSKSIQKPQIASSLREELEKDLRDDVNRLRDFTQQKFEAWSL